MPAIILDGSALQLTEFWLDQAHNDPAYQETDRRSLRAVVMKAGPVDLEPGDIIQTSGFLQATHDIEADRYTVPRRPDGALITAGWTVLVGQPEDGHLDPKPASGAGVIRRYVNTNWDVARHHELLDCSCISKPLGPSVGLPDSYVYVSMNVGWNPPRIYAGIPDGTSKVRLGLPQFRVMVHRD